VNNFILNTLLFSFIFLTSVCSLSSETMSAKSKIRNSSDEIVGLASLIQTDEGVSISVQVFNLPPGVHALHLHEKGKCKNPDFKSAGGHFNPYNREHGLKNPNGYHVGDLGNINVKEDSTGIFHHVSNLATLQKSDSSLLGKDGTSIVIHSGPDDLISNPTGNAGGRIACGVIKPL